MDRMIVPALLALAFAAAPIAAAADELPGCEVPDEDAEPIRSRTELDARLARCPSPLDLMTPGGRSRFLDSLAFNENGLVRVSPIDLQAELTGEEAGEVMRLFGMDVSTGLLPEEAERLRAARATGPKDDISGIERRFNRLQQARADVLESPDTEAARNIGRMYALLFPQEERAPDIEAAGSHDLRLLFRAAWLTASSTHDDEHLDAMRETFDALERKGLATRQDIRNLHSQLVRMGRFDESRTFARRHSAAGLQPLPPMREPATIDPSAPSAWNISADGDALLHEEVALEPVRIVVVASQGCGFSRAAARAIPGDPVLGPVFREHAVWITSPRDLDHLGALRRWNAANPDAALMVATSGERWPMLDLDIVPQFHVFRDGELVASVTGWMVEEGNRDEVIAALQESGLLEGP